MSTQSNSKEWFAFIPAFVKRRLITFNFIGFVLILFELCQPLTPNFAPILLINREKALGAVETHRARESVKEFQKCK